MAVTIVTNNNQRELIEYCNLSERWQKEFDYTPQDENFTPRFFQYGDWFYDAFDMLSTAENFPFNSGSKDLSDLGWDAYSADTYFSGVVFKWGHDRSGDVDYESVIVGRFAYLD